MTTRTTFNGSSTDVPWPNTGMPEGFGDQYARMIRTLFHASALPLTAVGGTANVITASLDPVLDGNGLVDGMRFGITWAAANTGAVTLALNGGAAVSVRDGYGAVLVAGRLQPGRRDMLEYIGGYFRIINGDPGADMLITLANFAAGNAGFPRLYLGALERLEVGTQIRTRKDAEVSVTTTTGTSRLVIGLIQGGAVRIAVDLRREGGNSAMYSRLIINRTRGGAQTALATLQNNSTSYATYTADISVLPGDEITCTQVSSDAGIEMRMRNLRIMTNGQDLWPGPVGGNVEGNRSLS